MIRDRLAAGSQVSDPGPSTSRTSASSAWSLYPKSLGRSEESSLGRVLQDDGIVPLSHRSWGSGGRQKSPGTKPFCLPPNAAFGRNPIEIPDSRRGIDWESRFEIPDSRRGMIRESGISNPEFGIPRGAQVGRGFCRRKTLTRPRPKPNRDSRFPKGNQFGFPIRDSRFPKGNDLRIRNRESGIRNPQKARTARDPPGGKL